MINYKIEHIEKSFGDNVILDNRPVAWRNTWEREPYWQRDLIAARLFSVASEQPVFLPNSVLSPVAQKIYQASGFAMPRHAIIYTDEKHQRELIKHYVSKGYRVTIQVPHQEGDVPSCAYLVDRSLLIFLNNKANLDRIIPARALAPRRKYTVAQLRNDLSAIQTWPVALKAGMPQPSMGGDEVFLCSDRSELLLSLDKLMPDAQVIVEPWLKHSKNICVQYTVDIMHGIQYLGAAEQVIVENSRHAGNVIDLTYDPPRQVLDALEEAVGLAKNLGYLGVVGFDVLIDEDSQRGWVIDANFRMNGSTIALLLAHRMGRAGQGDLFEAKNINFPLNDNSQNDRLISDCEQGVITPTAVIVDAERGLIHAGILRRLDRECQEFRVKVS